MQSPQNWFVESQGQIFEAELEELKQWIAEGAVLPSDKVKRGNLRWLAAEKVPELYAFFNSNDFTPAPSVVAATNIAKFNNEDFLTQFAFGNSPGEASLDAEAEKICFTHRDLQAVFVCDVCKSFFCKTCPNSYGTVKVCPLCSGLCRHADAAADIHKSIGAINKPYLKIDADINNYGKANQNGCRTSNAARAEFYRNPLILASAAVVFSLILGAVYFIWYKYV
ncbi:MAG TPA: hypothetical protein VK400_18160 [Pyrinomonadaceae bacterium]|nr:hypothetical protein [Pyrinomonadaceae bacterium]